MKKARHYSHLTIYRPRQPICPNAADERYFANKALDIITALVSGAGFTAAMLFLITLS